MVSLYLILLILGFVLLRRGLMGPFVSTPPACAKCRYDLAGLGNTAAICPECGASLLRKGSVRAHLRRRRPYSLVIGLTLLLVGAGGVGLFATRIIYTMHWTHYAPTSILISRLKSWDETTSPRVFYVLRGRWMHGHLSNSQATAFIDAILDGEPDGTQVEPIQWISVVGTLAQDSMPSKLPRIDTWLRARHADRSKPWHEYFSRTLEIQARRTGQEARLAEYLAGIAAPIATTNPPFIRSGESFEVLVDPRWRLSSRALLQLTVEVELDNNPARAPRLTLPEFRFGSDTDWPTAAPPAPRFQSLGHITRSGPPGEHRIPIIIRITALDAQPPIVHEFACEAIVHILDPQTPALSPIPAAAPPGHR